MHFKKILSASILASALIFCIPQAIYAAPDAKTETPVTYGWNSDALGRFFLTENGSRATGFCSIDQKVYYFDPDGYLFTPSQEGVMYLAQKPYYFLADGSVKTGLFSIKSESGISWYYAGANYQLFTNRTITLGGKIYCFGANGKSLPKGLQALNGKKYLISASGTAKTGRRKYKGKTYFFDSTGAMMIGKVTYKNKTNEEKTTYSAYAAVQPQSVSVNDIVLAKADGTTISTDKTITDTELNGMTVTVKGQTLTNGTQYSVTGFNVDKAGVQEVSVVLASPYTGKKIINVSNKMTDIAQAQITLGKNVYTYNPEGITPEVSKVVLGDKTLVAGTDYTVDKLTPNVTAYEKQPEINGAPNGAAVSITGTAATKINVVPENLESKCEVKVSETIIPVETLKNPAKLAKYVKVYYKTADGRKIDLSDTNNYTIKVANKNIIPE